MRNLPRSEAILAELCKRELRWFIRGAWPYIEPGIEFIDGWHIDAICEHLEALFRGIIRRLIVNIPPRCMKSTIASVMFPSWTWLQDPAFAMVTASYEHSLATRDAIKSRRLFETSWYERLNRQNEVDEIPQPIFKMRDTSIRTLARLKDTENWYENDRGGYRLAVGVDTGTTGKGGNLLAVDDPQDPRRAFSEAERIHTLTWWDQTMSTRFNNPKKDKKLIVMQRLHSFDLTGHELAKDLDYVHLKIPMEFDSRKRCVTSLGVEKEWSDPREQDGELMWPERIGPEEVAELKLNLGPFGWAGQEQQEPLPEGGGIFKQDYFRPWSGLPMFDVTCMSVDCSFTDAEQSSYVAIQGWGFKDTTPYLVKRRREHLSFVDTCDAILSMRKEMARERMTPSAILVENKANGPAVLSVFFKKVPGMLPCDPRKMGGSKVARAHAVAPLASRGVMLPEGAPWVAQFMLEVLNFPKYSSDDEVDAMTQALWWRYLSNIDPKSYQRKERFLQWSGVKVQ